MKLSQLLRKDSNNLDIFRVIAACMVIYGHAYHLGPQEGKTDFIRRITTIDYSGSLAVKLFFFLSGLVVTNSLLQRRSPMQFVVSRAFRIWPALIFTLVVSAFLIGPVVSSLSVSKYFSSRSVYHYLASNTLMQMTYGLPGVFSENLNKAVNGSLWSLPYEVAAYITLLALFLLGAFRSKLLLLLIAGALIIEPLLSDKILFTWLKQPHEIDLILACFAFGSILAVFKDSVEVGAKEFIGTWLLFFLFKDNRYYHYFMYLATFYSVLYLSSLSLVRKLKPKADVSYGIYLWGFPIQQLMLSQYGHLGIGFNQVSTMALSFVMALVSWHLVEKRCVALGSTLGKSLQEDVSPWLAKYNERTSHELRSMTQKLKIALTPNSSHSAKEPERSLE